jgi:hypothetical protein
MEDEERAKRELELVEEDNKASAINDQPRVASFFKLSLTNSTKFLDLELTNSKKTKF